MTRMNCSLCSVSHMTSTNVPRFSTIDTCFLTIHFSRWPQFDRVARQVLFDSRYKIEVPDDVSVFEHFFDFGSKIHPGHTKSTRLINPKVCL